MHDDAIDSPAPPPSVLDGIRPDLPRLLLLSVAVGLIYLLYQRLGSPIDPTGETSTFLWVWIRWNSVEHSCGKVYRYLGPLIPVISLALVWLKRNELRRATRSVSWLGLGCVLLALLMHWIGVKTEHVRLSMISFVVLVFGSIWFLQGWVVARMLIFPVGFLLFVVPLNFLNSAVNQFRVLTARVEAAVLNGLGMECQSLGMAILGVGEDPFQYTLQAGPVVFRDVLLVIMIGSLVAYLTQPDTLRRLMLFPLLLIAYPLCLLSVITLLGLLIQVFGEGVRGPLGDNVMSVMTFTLLSLVGWWLAGTLRNLDLSAFMGSRRGNHETV